MSLLLLVLVLPLRASQSAETLDPAFQTVPFDQWLTEHTALHFHWTASVPRTVLSFHQRLESGVLVELDGRDLETRRKDGEIVVFFQITDSQGTHFQGHAAIQLDKLDENIKAATIQTMQRAFLLPGDYQLAVALLDTGSREHDAGQFRFRIPPANSNLLSPMWRDLPSVEFIRDRESPDSWFLPDIRGRLQEFTSLRTAATLNVVLNVAPSAASNGSHASTGGSMSALLPTLKVISEPGSPQLSENIEVLDLARHRAVFKSQTLDWSVLKSSLREADTASIDLHSLADRHEDAQFFLAEVRRILRTEGNTAPGKASILVILSAPVAFESGQDLEPVSLEGLPACRVFYIRYQPASARFTNRDDLTSGRRGMRMGGPIGNRGASAAEVVDRLASTLKPLNPKVIEVQTPEDVTKALNEIQKALAG